MEVVGVEEEAAKVTSRKMLELRWMLWRSRRRFWIWRSG